MKPKPAAPSVRERRQPLQDSRDAAPTPAGPVVGANDTAGNSKEIAAADAAPERPVYDKNGELLCYAVGVGPGWPPDCDAEYKRWRR